MIYLRLTPNRQVGKGAQTLNLIEDRPAEETQEQTQTGEVLQLSQHKHGELDGMIETNSSSNDLRDDLGNSNRICRFYKNGNCKHGLRGKDCKFSHPNMCQKFTQHGTNKQKDAILEKNTRISIPKCALIPYAKVNVSTNPVASLM